MLAGASLKLKKGYIWWLVSVTLVVTSGFLPPTFWEVVGIIQQVVDITGRRPRPFSSHACACQGVLEKPTLFATEE